MRPSRNSKSTSRYRTKQQTCSQYLGSTWPTIHSDNDDTTLNDTSCFLASMNATGVLPAAFSSTKYNRLYWIGRKLAYGQCNERKYGRKPSPKTLSTPILRSLGDTDDTEDEEFPQRGRLSSSSSQVSWDILRRQATSMGSLTSSYSSLGERSASTLSPLDDLNLKRSLSTSLKAILDPDFSGDFDYDQDPKMRETIEEIVSPKPIRTTKTLSVSLNEVPTSSLAAVDPSILVALPGRRSDTPEAVPSKYSPTALCDFSVILAGSPPVADVVDSRSDLAQLRAGTQPVNDKHDDPSMRPGWDIPEEADEGEVLVAQTKIPYRKLSETSDSGDDCCLILRHNLSLLSQNLSSSLSSTSRSRSSSLSSDRDSSDYLADVSGEETTSSHVIVWPPCKKLRINLEEDSAPFVLSPRIPGVDYYGVPTTVLVESPGRVARGLDAFFNSRSIVHRLGPHGLEQVYDMESCPERCGFAYPVPPRKELII